VAAQLLLVPALLLLHIGAGLAKELSVCPAAVAAPELGFAAAAAAAEGAAAAAAAAWDALQALHQAVLALPWVACQMFGALPARPARKGAKHLISSAAWADTQHTGLAGCR
jgi:hypothetical protein